MSPSTVTTGLSPGGARSSLRLLVGGAALLVVIATTDSRCVGLQPLLHGPVGDNRPPAAASGLRFAGDVTPGYVLFSPLLSTTTYLVDRRGRVVHTWESDRAPGASQYLLDNGHLLRCARERDTPIFQAGGEGGRIQEYTWDGKLVWDYALAGPSGVQHHDIEPLPDGNVLAIVWEPVSASEALRLGRTPAGVAAGGLLLDALVEIEPRPPRDGRIVWEWHARDHLIQDVDPQAPGYGVVADHPERIDINGDRQRQPLTEDIMDRLRAIGYMVGNSSAGGPRTDLSHVNAVAYNGVLDQVLLSAHAFNEIWVIDHSTTTSEAAGSAGGRAGKGGDLLYRWGNPRAYGRGTADDQRLFAHHDARWIPPGFPGAGNILIFNNGSGRPGDDHSSVEEIVPPLEADGTYRILPGSPFGPGRPAWTYAATPRSSFFADFISGAHRLADGNTFICAGPTGRFFEVTLAGEIVWEYLNPFAGSAPNPAGDPARSVFRATFIPADHPALAQKLGISQQAVARAERWGAIPTVRFITRWANACGRCLEIRLASQ